VEREVPREQCPALRPTPRRTERARDALVDGHCTMTAMAEVAAVAAMAAIRAAAAAAASVGIVRCVVADPNFD